MNQYNLTMEQITAYRTWLSGEEKSAGTIEKYLRDIGAFARWLKGAPVSKDRTSEWKTHLLAQGYARHDQLHAGGAERLVPFFGVGRVPVQVFAHSKAVVPGRAPGADPRGV